MYKEKFKNLNCYILVSKYELIKKLLSKELTYFLCKKYNIKTPKIYFNIKEIYKKNKKFIRKKIFGHTSIGNLYIKKINSGHFKKDCIIQDFIEGKNSILIFLMTLTVIIYHHV